MTKNAFAAIVCLILVGARVFAQTDTTLSKVKFTKTERIWFAAYDDTTKALATLFVSKRNQINRDQKTILIVCGVSAIALGVGALMLERDLNSSPTAYYNAANYLGLLLALGGALGVFSTAPAAGVGFIRLNPYTVKKYEKLIAMHKSGKPLPEFYVSKITTLLRRK